MKKLVLLLGVFALIMSSCTQDLPVADTNVEQEVIFTSNDLKGFKVDFYDCDAVAAYAEVVITNSDGDYLADDPSSENHQVVYASTLPDPIVDYPVLTIPVFYVNDVMYTQAIKLPSGESGLVYVIHSFFLYDDEGTPVNAVPLSDSEYGQMVSSALPKDISVSPFTKVEVGLSILCYSETEVQEFGFNWFRIDKETFTNKFFFGDFCTKFYLDYTNDHPEGHANYSLYNGTGLALVDMPAIFRLTLSTWNGSDWDVLNVVSNESIITADPYVPGPLSLVYNPTVTSTKFKVGVEIYVKQGASFDYESFGTYYFKPELEDKLYSDADMDAESVVFTPGIDGVYDFILGNCNANGADIVFAPYMNLPSSGINLDLVYTGGDNDAYSYWTAEFTNIAPGYDVTMLDPLTGKAWGVYCIDHATGNNMGTGTYSNVGLFSTLDIPGLPGYVQDQNIPWANVNWLINNLDQFEAITWKEIQVAIWMIESGKTFAQVNSVNADEDKVNEIVAEATDSDKDSFVPMPGQYAAVILDLDFEKYQAIFTIVDP